MVTAIALAAGPGTLGQSDPVEPSVGAVPLRLEAIEFEGNRRTRAEILLQELLFHHGDPVTLDDIEGGRQAILDLQLFKAVEYRLDGEIDRKVLTYVVEEKHFWYALPRVDRSGDGDITIGAQGEFTNLNGRNQTLDWVISRKKLKDADVSEERRLDLTFMHPRVGGGRYSLWSQIHLEQSELDETRGARAGQYERDLKSLQLRVAKWLREQGASQGWRIGVGLQWEEYGHRFISGDPGLFFDATILIYSGILDYRDLHDRVFSRMGRTFQYRLEVASIQVGSDADFLRHTAEIRRYIPLKFREHSNLNLQVVGGYATGSVFGDPTYSLGGSDTLRGFGRDVSEGDAFVQGNAEFLFPLRKTKPSFRGAAFLDFGNAYADLGDVDLLDQRVDVGVGVRWTVRSLVRATLRLDVGHGLTQDGETKIFVGTNAIF